MKEHIMTINKYHINILHVTLPIDIEYYLDESM